MGKDDVGSRKAVTYTVSAESQRIGHLKLDRIVLASYCNMCLAIFHWQTYVIRASQLEKH